MAPIRRNELISSEFFG